MRIEKTAIQTKPGRFKTVYKPASFLSNEPKMKLRYLIEQNAINDEDVLYDIYDMVADMANATKDVIQQLTESNKVQESLMISKFINRQNKIQELLEKSNTPITEIKNANEVKLPIGVNEDGTIDPKLFNK